ncbi:MULTISPECIES: DUF4124 domain-containing protein [Acinetobacter]|uniref:DUF4124 domain-containing protein n=1 Tax=Acinetobacter TaxID=469 RepID=UPI000EA07FBC|nr:MULTISPECIES: DUF4124 domain-containing protein [Acinetobacter]RKG43836.1 DUF4124 domain-containing protein [Acinetobacter cumulans]RZG59551.1 DUF4124 domain-containing protein [Acinetobacter sp. WCHAc060006]
MRMSVLKITTFILLCIPVNLYAGVYKWVDAKGNVTYSSKPPPTGAKQQKIETIRSLGSAPAPQRTYSQSNRNSAQQSYQSQNYSRQTYSQPQQQTRSAEQEAERQALLRSASTPYSGARGLTASQRNTLSTLNGGDNSSGGYSNSSQRQPSTVSNCDSSGCWGSDGTRYNRGAGDTYFPSTGGSCQNVGGQMQCN